MLGCPPRQNVTNVILDEAFAANGTIGPEGGTVAATAGDGTEYTLEVPANALAEPVDITITPVTGIRNLPLSGGFAGAVDLQPAGLQFARSATLTITGAPAAPSGMIPIGFSYEGDADTLALAIAGEEGGALTLLVQHFSGGGVGFGTLQDVQAMPLGDFLCAAFIDDVLDLSATAHEPQAEVSLFRDMFTQCVLPDLQNATNDDELNRAVSEYELWANTVSVALDLPVRPGTSPEFVAERQQAADVAAERLRAAIAGNNAVAAAQQSFSAVANVLFWQKQAELFEMNLQAEQLSRETVLLSIPLNIQMDPVTLPDTLQAGFPHSLDLQFSVVFQGHPNTPQAAPMLVNLTATGATLQNPTGFTSVNGFYTTVITATGAGNVGVTIEACLVLPVIPPTPPAQPTATDLCFHDFVDAQGVDLTGTWEGTFTVNLGTGGQASAPIRITLDQNQNAITGTYDVLGDDVDHFGTVSATLSGPELLGFTLTQQAGCPASFTGSATVSTLPGGQDQIVATFNGSDCHNTHSGGSSTVIRQ
jgi:hypothetical protein